jgi:hypothetical protein
MWLATSCNSSSVYALPNGGIEVPATPERAVVMMSSIVRPLSSGLPSWPPSPRGP